MFFFCNGQRNEIGEDSVIKVQFNSTEWDKGFVEGQTYIVILRAFNGAGPPLNATINSTQVIVDFSPPVFEKVFNTYVCLSRDMCPRLED